MAARFVTFEGLDGSGKSWHLRQLGHKLELAGVPFRATHEPGGTPLGEAIRGLFLDRRWGRIDGLAEAMLLFASRRHLLAEVIDPALAAGCHVLCDRFTDSTLAYQGTARGVELATLLELDRLATGARRPDLTVLFDCPAEVAWERRHSGTHAAAVDRLDAEGIEFYRRVRNAYHELARSEPHRFRTVDSSGERERTAEKVLEATSELFGPVVAFGAASQ